MHLNWRNRPVNAVVPEGEGTGVSVTFRMPEKLLARLDACAKATNNSRTDVILHLLRAALTQWESEHAASKSKKSA